MNTTGKLGVEDFGSPEIQKLDLDYFPYPWSTKQWIELDPVQNVLFSWRVQNQLIGYCLLGLPYGDDVAHLYKILIAPKYQGQGQASHFWGAIVQTLKMKKFSRVYLEVEFSNKAAIKFYENIGFLLLRKNKGYYSNGEDALMMELML